MSNQREDKINRLLDFPYDAFLMVRLEYVQILRSELQAKLLRIIEKYVEQERKNIYQKMLNGAGTAQQEMVEIPKDLWVPISYRLFMNDLFGTVKSENTIKAALADMAHKHIIFHRFEPKKKYDAPEYKINVTLLQDLLHMICFPGYQNLIPSVFDTLKNLDPQNLIPSGYQKLILSIIEPCSESDSRVSEIDTTITEDYDNNSIVITEGDGANAPTPAHLKQQVDEKLEEVKTASGKHKAVSSHSQGLSENDEDISLAETAHRMPAVKIGAPNANSHLHPGDNIATTGDNRIHSLQDLRGTEEDEQQNITSGELVPSQDDAAPAANPPASSGPRASRVVPSRPRNTSRARDPLPVPAEAERIMDDWDSLFKSPLARTEKHIKAAISLVPCNPSKADLKACKNWLFTTDNPQKPWFRKKGVALQDIAENYGQWQSVQDEPQEEASEQEYGVSGLPRLKPLGSVK